MFNKIISSQSTAPINQAIIAHNNAVFEEILSELKIVGPRNISYEKIQCDRTLVFNPDQQPFFDNYSSSNNNNGFYLRCSRIIDFIEKGLPKHGEKKELISDKRHWIKIIAEKGYGKTSLKYELIQVLKSNGVLFHLNFNNASHLEKSNRLNLYTSIKEFIKSTDRKTYIIVDTLDLTITLEGISKQTIYNELAELLAIQDNVYLITLSRPEALNTYDLTSSNLYSLSNNSVVFELQGFTQDELRNIVLPKYYRAFGNDTFSAEDVDQILKSNLFGVLHIPFWVKHLFITYNGNIPKQIILDSKRLFEAYTRLVIESDRILGNGSSSAGQRLALIKDIAFHMVLNGVNTISIASFLSQENILNSLISDGVLRLNSAQNETITFQHDIYIFYYATLYLLSCNKLERQNEVNKLLRRFYAWPNGNYVLKETIIELYSRLQGELLTERISFLNVLLGDTDNEEQSIVVDLSFPDERSIDLVANIICRIETDLTINDIDIIKKYSDLLMDTIIKYYWQSSTNNHSCLIDHIVSYIYSEKAHITHPIESSNKDRIFFLENIVNDSSNYLINFQKYLNILLTSNDNLELFGFLSSLLYQLALRLHNSNLRTDYSGILNIIKSIFNYSFPGIQGINILIDLSNTYIHIQAISYHCDNSCEFIYDRLIDHALTYKEDSIHNKVRDFLFSLFPDKQSCLLHILHRADKTTDPKFWGFFYLPVLKHLSVDLRLIDDSGLDQHVDIIRSKKIDERIIRYTLLKIREIRTLRHQTHTISPDILELANIINSIDSIDHSYSFNLRLTDIELGHNSIISDEFFIMNAHHINDENGMFFDKCFSLINKNISKDNNIVLAHAMSILTITITQDISKKVKACLSHIPLLHYKAAHYLVESINNLLNNLDSDCSDLLSKCLNDADLLKNHVVLCGRLLDLCNYFIKHTNNESLFNLHQLVHLASSPEMQRNSSLFKKILGLIDQFINTYTISHISELKNMLDAILLIYMNLRAYKRSLNILSSPVYNFELMISELNYYHFFAKSIPSWVVKHNQLINFNTIFDIFLKEDIYKDPILVQPFLYSNISEGNLLRLLNKYSLSEDPYYDPWLRKHRHRDNVEKAITLNAIEDNANRLSADIFKRIVQAKTEGIVFRIFNLKDITDSELEHFIDCLSHIETNKECSYENFVKKLENTKYIKDVKDIIDRIKAFINILKQITIEQIIFDKMICFLINYLEVTAADKECKQLLDDIKTLHLH